MKAKNLFKIILTLISAVIIFLFNFYFPKKEPFVILYIFSIFCLTNLITTNFINFIFSFFYKKNFLKKNKFFWLNSFKKYNFSKNLSNILSGNIVLFIIKNFIPNIFCEKFVYIYLILSSFFIIISFLNSSLEIYNHYEFSKIFPIGWLLDLIKIILFFISIIFVIAILYKNFSFWKFFSSLGALTALILLLFKDSLLGFVSSIVLVKNNMIKMRK